MRILLLGKFSPAKKQAGTRLLSRTEVKRCPLHRQPEVHHIFIGGISYFRKQFCRCGSIDRTDGEAHFRIVVTVGRLIGGIEVCTIVATLLGDVGLHIFGRCPVETTQLVVGVLVVHHISRCRKEYRITVDARSGFTAEHPAHRRPRPIAVVDEFIPLRFSGHTPLVAPLHMSHVIIGAGEGSSEFVVCLPLVAIPVVVVGIIPLICFE